MRPVLAILFTLVALAPARAQSRSPELTSLALPLALRTTVEGHGEQGCSRGFARSDYDAIVGLTIDASGAAVMTLDGSEHTYTVTPEVAGRHDDATTHLRWSGTASVSGNVLSVAFTPAAYVLRCETTPIAVENRTVSLLRCTWIGGGPSEMEFYVPEDVVLGAGPGLHETWERPRHDAITRSFRIR